MRATAGLILSLFCISANAALLSRASGQAYYDTVLNITWVADANLSQTSGYDADGLMTWSGAQTWIASLNTASYLSVNNWRLPTVTDTGAPGCAGIAYSGTDCGYNVDLSTGEMARMFYSTLGNTGYYNTSGSPTGCSGSSPYCLTNDGPFSNLQPSGYWSDTVNAASPSSAWFFGFHAGNQYYATGTNSIYAWAVRPGDIAPVPVPAAAWLFGSALGVLGVMKRRASR